MDVLLTLLQAFLEYELENYDYVTLPNGATEETFCFGSNEGMNLNEQFKSVLMTGNRPENDKESCMNYCKEKQDPPCKMVLYDTGDKKCYDIDYDQIKDATQVFQNSTTTSMHVYQKCREILNKAKEIGLSRKYFNLTVVRQD